MLKIPEFTLVLRTREIIDFFQHIQWNMYPAAMETQKLVNFKLLENKICWIQEIYVTRKTNCIVYR